MDRNTASVAVEQLVTSLSTQFSVLLQTLGTAVRDEALDLAALEQQVLHHVHAMGATVLAGLPALRAPDHPQPTVPCPCGQLARFQRQRPATVLTLLGRITFARPYYLCAACGHGQHPLDAELHVCAGSRSAGLDELLALLGATQDSFAQAATVLQRLSLVHVSPSTVRDATQQLGAVLVTQQAQHVAAAQAGLPRTPADPSPPERLYITMDGVLAHLHARGWSELKVGCCYQTRPRRVRGQPEHGAIQAHHLSYVSSAAEAETFGWHLWQEAARRGVVKAAEVVVLGDGAHWIWNLAAPHFPGATEIVDWYHASQYVWQAATTIWGETGTERTAWAERQLAALWDGDVTQVLGALAEHQAAGAGVTAAISYYTTHQQRMNYAAYRARGLHIGSGSVESACKQVVSARLKQAGMIWDVAGAEAVAAVRAWLKSERWTEAVALRSWSQRGYQKRGEGTPAPARGSSCQEPAVPPPPSSGAARQQLPANVLAPIRADLAPKPDQHPWRRAWSRKRQREQASVPRTPPTTAAA